MYVVAVVAHQDDEVLGVGGTLARHVLEGDRVRVVVLCDQYIEKKNHFGYYQLDKACETLGIKEVVCFGNPDQMLESENFQNVVRSVNKSVLEDSGGFPSIVYTHWYKDLNRDHCIANEVVQVVFRPKMGLLYEVREFPTPSSTEYSREPFAPDTWIDITGEPLQRKLKAIDCYASEKQGMLLPRNRKMLEEIARVRGSEVGLEYAEVFSTARRVL